MFPLEAEAAVLHFSPSCRAYLLYVFPAMWWFSLLRFFRWIHHLARHAVACFLTRGDLWQSWEDGAAVFDELLLDADWSINNFNWQWLSCSAFFYQASHTLCRK